MRKLADRIERLHESQTIAMARLSRELQDQGHNIISLSLGEPDFDTPKYIGDAAKKAIDDGFTKYPPISGYADVREAISQKLKRENNLDYKASQIVVSTGAKQCIANAVLCCVNPGDEVLVPTPYWVSYSQIIQLAGGVPIYLNTTIDSDFKVTPQQVEKAITSKTRMFIFSSPCNPTGTVYSHDELKALAAVFAKHENIFVLSDEIYEYINFVGKHHSIASFEELKNQVIIINGVSKGYAMTGWRIGYMAAPQDVATACDKMQGQFTSAASSIAQKAAKAAISISTPDRDMMVETFRKRRDLVLNLMKDIPGWKTNTPEGAFYVFPDISYYFGKTDGSTVINNPEDMCMYLLKDAKVALVTGEAFGDNQCIRFSYATSDKLLTEAIARIKVSLAKLK
ncbi:MAG TPA: pyridoxal phosphate-dependent aminotransferase [Bacteroidia bacterium]|nr:pyridoxal phosphate-dependent aminotransferase [Bacteroidia bacterium]QQR96028.1 MAG: pyridoxal phosphate-dependent aminotransferase [Bacteroidota bacterium]MBP7713623.1 pyridoxal phosphate-dependent aminotransferase [Bacteroidia bacterium]MBP8667429.1 pyridoxal phosphate-dependent aminotransferase [Bacteroidia bacterium]HOZ81337.1 pyridoxal phosphate-dependent aminotransferase [Bacteroidia bacterium]